MNNKTDMKSKVYQIILYANCFFLCIGALFSGIDILRLLIGRSANPFSVFAFPLFLLALVGIYRLEKSKKSGKLLLVLGELLGALVLACGDPDPISAIIIFVGMLLLHILSYNWKTGYNQHKENPTTGNIFKNGQNSSITHQIYSWINNHLSSNADNNTVLLNQYVPQKEDFDVFISYRREDGQQHARNIQLALEAKGYKIFFDYDSIQKGEFTKKIIDAIYSCNDFILILSPRSMKRCRKKGDPVANELRTAAKYHKNIIPITIDNKVVSWPKFFPKDLQFIQELQFHDHKSDSYFKKSIDELCSKLTTTISGK